MKKFQKICAVLTALVLGLICFAGCSNDAGGSSDNGGNVSNNGGGNNGGGNSNNEEETPKVTVVAEWKSYDNIYYYKFCSDKTYELRERAKLLEKGKYYGTSSPRQIGVLTLTVEQEYDEIAGTLITSSTKYEINFYKDYYTGIVFLQDNHYREYDLVE